MIANATHSALINVQSGSGVDAALAAHHNCVLNVLYPHSRAPLDATLGGPAPPIERSATVPFVVFSGLPGSGKSTLARRLGPALGLPVLDKDDFLDMLFDERGIGDLAWRAALSREADLRFAAAAQALVGACLVSWWRHPNAVATESGTPTDWLQTLRGPVVEVYCHCNVEIATSRFVARARHPGHLDSLRTLSTLRAQFRSTVASPLGCGPMMSVATDDPVAIPTLVDRVRNALRA